MHKVVVDTNVILSGILFGGHSASLLELVVQRAFHFCSSSQNYEEVIDKLTNKFKVDADVIEGAKELFCNATFYEPTASVDFPADPDDAYLLELCETCEADYLITGDLKHLTPLQQWKSTKIMTPAKAVQLLQLEIAN